MEFMGNWTLQNVSASAVFSAGIHRKGDLMIAVRACAHLNCSGPARARKISRIDALGITIQRHGQANIATWFAFSLETIHLVIHSV